MSHRTGLKTIITTAPKTRRALFIDLDTCSFSMVTWCPPPLRPT